MLFPGAWRRMGVCVCGGGVMSNCVKIMLGFTQSQLPFLPPPLVFLRQSVTNALTPTLPFHFLLFPPVLLSYTLTRPPFSLSPPPPPLLPSLCLSTSASMEAPQYGCIMAVRISCRGNSEISISGPQMSKEKMYIKS